MPQQPALIGLAALTGRARRWQGAVVILARLFRLAARTVYWVGEPLRAGVLHVRHDQAGVDALVGHLDLDHHAAQARPRPGLGPCRGAARALAPLTLRSPLGLRAHLSRHLRQDASAGPTGHIPEGRWLLDPLHPLRGGTVAIAAHDQQGSGPGLASPLA